MPSQSYGVYFSANDAVLDWTQAFLQSFRETNSDLPLYLIPFNNQYEKLATLAQEFQFDIFEDESFAQLEELGSRYELGHTAHGKYWFRRFAVFWGPLTHFAYLDARQLILSNLSPYIEAVAHGGIDLIHFDTAINQVYSQGPLRRRLVLKGKARGFNSGRWFSRSGAFSKGELLELGAQSLEERDQLNARNTDQAFMNYCFDHKDLVQVHIADLFDDVARSGWARQSGRIYKDADNVYRLWDHGGLDHMKRIVLLHWAGIPLAASMPRRDLFLKFLLRKQNNWVAAGARLRDLAVYPFEWTLETVRKNRFANRTWKTFRNIVK